MKTKSGISFFSSSLLESAPVAHAFLSRRGGVSEPPFDTLNFDTRGGDPEESVGKNLSRVSDAFGIDAGKLVTVNQVHGSNVLVVDDRNQHLRKKVDADAIVTALTGVPIGILTADCLPVFLYDPVKGAVAAVHAGWKGSAAGVVLKTIEMMKKRFSTRASDLLAALGPYIGPCCYAIKENAASEFERSFGSSSVDYIQNIYGEMRLDIGMANISQLIGAGVLREKISMVAACTSCNNGLLFSYRKDNGVTGRQLSFIMLKE
jgi:YfiH family protein